MMTSVKVQAERLPGVGWQYSVPIDPGRQLMIIVEDRATAPDAHRPVARRAADNRAVE
jgi:hypothetical protein